MDMSTAIVYSRSQCVRPHRVMIEAIISSSVKDDSLRIEGLSATASLYAMQTLQSAIIASGYKFPAGDVLLIVKDASSCPQEDFGVAMAVAVLIASNQIRQEGIEQYRFYGRLQGSGSINPDENVLSALYADSKEGFVSVLAQEDMEQYFFLNGALLMGFQQLKQLCEHLRGITPRSYVATALPEKPLPKLPLSLLSLPVSQHTHDALIVAAAGGHGVLQFRRGGVHRSAEALALLELMPKLGSEWINVAMRRVACGRLLKPDQWGQRPAMLIEENMDEQTLFGPIAQDHGAQHLGLIGMAQLGIAFFNAAYGFNARLLTALNRWRQQASTVAKPTLEELTQYIVMVSATSCPAGCEGHSHFCTCSEQDLNAYQRELEEVAMQCCQVWTTSVHTLPKPPLPPEDAERISREILARIVEARLRQQLRGAGLNGSLSAEELQRHCKLSEAAEVSWYENSMCVVNAGARLRALAVALTLADLDGSDIIEKSHMDQALIFTQLPVTLPMP